MRFIKASLTFLIVFSLTVSPSQAKQVKKKTKKQAWITARSFVVLDIDDGRVLFARRPYLKLPSASTVKIMTAIVVLENYDFNKPVFVSLNAAGTQASKAYLTASEYYSPYDLLQALLISSSNDAAVALAESLAGSEQEFVRLMNQKAKRLGMHHTHFVNASGLPDKRKQQYSTTYDLARLMRYAVKNSLFTKIMNKQTAVICGSDGKKIYLTNHNKFLKSNPGFVIGKTGYTLKAGHCFVGTDNSGPRDITFAILCSRNPWQDIRRLTDYGLRLEKNNTGRKNR